VTRVDTVVSPEAQMPEAASSADGTWGCSTAYWCHCAGTPFSSCAPRSSNRRSEPDIRSRTVLDTKTWPGSALDITRALMWMAIPPTLGPITSTSPMWMPARTSMPRPYVSHHLLGAADSLGGLIEGGEESISCCVDLTPPVLFEPAPNERVVRSHDLPPPLVAHFRGPLGRGDDVREQDRREESLGRLGRCSFVGALRNAIKPRKTHDGTQHSRTPAGNPPSNP
jgi:hypothetical protein